MNSDIEQVLQNPFIQTIIVIIIASLIKMVSGNIIDRIVRQVIKSHKYVTRAEERKREDTISKVFGTLTGVVIWIVAIGTIASIFNLNFGAIAASAGFIGIIIGLGAQTTIRDYVAGIYILLENQYRVGDIVTLSGGTTGIGTSGVVEDISLRITKLRDLDGTLNIVRNGEASIITNRTFEYSSVVVDVTVAFGTDIDKVERVMNEVGNAMLEDETYGKLISDAIQYLRVDKFTDSGVTVKAVGKVMPAEQWTIAGDFRRRLLKAFAHEKITIAVPQIVVHGIETKHLQK
ncbi:mechanosensitive ion channel family protein [bacterium]|nr:MAG: mechanosensitive ion channel family protein [bacterium]